MELSEAGEEPVHLPEGDAVHGAGTTGPEVGLCNLYLNSKKAGPHSLTGLTRTLGRYSKQHMQGTFPAFSHHSSQRRPPKVILILSETQ